MDPDSSIVRGRGRLHLDDEPRQPEIAVILVPAGPVVELTTVAKDCLEDLELAEQPDECVVAERTAGGSSEEITPILQGCSSDVAGVVPVDRAVGPSRRGDGR